MWSRKAYKNRKEHNSKDPHWTWSKLYNDYYHRRKDGTYKWLNPAKTRAMAEALEYAKLSRGQIDTARGFRITFSKAPGSRGGAALLNRKVTNASGNMNPTAMNPRVQKYEVSYSPLLSVRTDGLMSGNGGGSGKKLRHIEDPGKEYQRYIRGVKARGGGGGGSSVRNETVAKVSLSKESGVIAPSVDTTYRELSLSKVSEDPRQITTIRLSVHDSSPPPSPDTPQPPNKSHITTKNHWSLYLILKDGGTVRVNMTISELEREILEWTLLSFPLSLSQIRAWDFQVMPGITVAMFWKLIHDKGRHKYNMGVRRDCDRWWIFAIFHDLSKRGWLRNENCREHARSLLSNFYTLDGKSKRMELVAGSFY